MTNAKIPNKERPNRENSDWESARDPIRVLLLCHSANSPVRALIASIPLVHVCSPTETADSAALERQAIDVAMLELSNGSPAAVEDLHRAHPALPIIVLATRNQEDAALDLLPRGASDYLLTEELDLDSAARALRYALNLSRLRRRVQDLNRHLELANHRLRELFLPATEQIGGRAQRVAATTSYGVGAAKA